MPTSTAKRLSKNSLSVEIFNSAKIEYEIQTTKVEKSSGLTCHIAKAWLLPLPKVNKLQKIFNRNTMKVNFSFLYRNISSIVSSQNKKSIKNNDPNTKPCICRTKSIWSLICQCQSQDVIYKYTVSTSVNPDKVYLGIALGDFKKHYYNRTKSFHNKRYTNDISLPK